MIPEDRQKRLKEIVDLLASEKDHDRYLELMKEMSAILDEIDSQAQKRHPD